MKRVRVRVLIATAVVLVCGSATAAARSVPARAAGTADLSVTLSAPATVNQGEEIVYAATVQNAGPDGASGVVLTDPMPTGLSFDSSNSTSGCSLVGSTVTCQLPSIPANLHLAPRVTFRTASTGTVSNTVNATANETDPTPGDNSASAQTTVGPPVSADLGVRLTGPGQVDEGQSFFETLAVSNSGPDTSTGTSATLTVPAGLSPDFSGCTASASGETCTFAYPTLSPGQGVEDMYRFTATSAGQQTLSATATSNQQDPNPSNNTATATISVATAADLSLSAGADPNPVVPGHQVTETIVLTNNGPSPATAPSWTASWTSDAKGGIDFESMSVTAGDCTLSAATISCRPGDLANGQQVVLTIVVQPRSKGTLTFDSSVASSVFDPNTANNSVSTSVSIS